MAFSYRPPVLKTVSMPLCCVRFAKSERRPVLLHFADNSRQRHFGWRAKTVETDIRSLRLKNGCTQVATILNSHFQHPASNRAALTDTVLKSTVLCFITIVS